MIVYLSYLSVGQLYILNRLPVGFVNSLFVPVEFVNSLFVPVGFVKLPTSFCRVRPSHILLELLEER